MWNLSEEEALVLYEWTDLDLMKPSRIVVGARLVLCGLYSELSFLGDLYYLLSSDVNCMSVLKWLAWERKFLQTVVGQIQPKGRLGAPFSYKNKENIYTRK